MKIVSWNINGLNNAFKKGHLKEFLHRERPDILCLQEVRCSQPSDISEYNHTYFHCAKKKGYSGTSISCNFLPLNVWRGFNVIGDPIEDDEGRVIAIEHEHFIIVSVYVPNSKPDLSRLDWKTTVWFRALIDLIAHYKSKKHVIVCGDMNVAHQEIDVHNAKTKHKTHGFTKEERTIFNEMLDTLQLQDTFRDQHPNTIKYSWWSNFANSRARNVGWRIDYFLTTKGLNIADSDIIITQTGSDHAPLVLRIFTLWQLNYGTPFISH